MTEKTGIRSIPLFPLLLGLSGLIPFLWGALTSVIEVDFLSPDWQGRSILANYSLVIVPFMSGVIWGFAMRAEGVIAARFYALSVVPVLWAFFMVRPDITLFAPAIGFTVLLPIDDAATRLGLAPAWWMSLRLLLSVVVFICLVAGEMLAPLSTL